MTRSKGLVAAVALAALVLAAAPAALAKDGDVRVAGSCTGSSTSKLKLSEENGRIEVEFEVDQNRNGVVWNVILKRNGVRVHQGAATTKRPSGSFTVRRLVTNGGGPDVIRAKATRAGQSCTAIATF